MNLQSIKSPALVTLGGIAATLGVAFALLISPATLTYPTAGETQSPVASASVTVSGSGGLQTTDSGFITVSGSGGLQAALPGVITVTGSGGLQSS